MDFVRKRYSNQNTLVSFCRQRNPDVRNYNLNQPVFEFLGRGKAKQQREERIRYLKKLIQDGEYETVEKLSRVVDVFLKKEAPHLFLRYPCQKNRTTKSLQ